MPLPLPRLDNRTFAELVAEGRALLPRLAPVWTDHNIHDPGIALLELLAWLTEIDIYRLDRTLEASYRAFLRLVGVELRPAQVADTVLVVSLEPAGNPVLLPSGLQVGDSECVIVFQTTAPLHVSPAQMVVVLAGQAGDWVDHTVENQTSDRLYRPFGSQPAPDSALYLGFDRPLAEEPVRINLYVWTGAPAADRETRRQLAAEWETAQAESAKLYAAGCGADGPEWWRHYSVRTVWEYYTAAGEWAALPDVSDETRALTLSGPVSFTAPLDQAPGEPDDQHLFIRCRLLGGHYECPPAIDRVALNTVAARHAADVKPEVLLGLSNGRAGQRFQASDRPIVPGSTRLKVVVGAVEDEPWREVQFWDRAGPHERAYLLAPERGEIRFGNGRAGRVPPAAAELWLTHQVGAGPVGNVAAGTLTEALAGPHNAALVPDWENVRPALQVTQPVAALGGAAAETLAEARGRALAALAERRGAITLADFAALALETPGVPLARAHALADYHPAVPCFPAPGCVTVVVIPHCPDPSPTPGPDLLRAVARYVERRRMLTTQVHVVGPCYTPVIVHARLHVAPRTVTSGLAALAQRALDDFFHPLYGGPDGAGWPVGRDVYRAEVMALLNRLPGVDYVDELGLQTTGDAEPRCGNLPICADGLVASGQHKIVIDIVIDNGWSAAAGSRSVADCGEPNTTRSIVP
jgi:predicted phage baseplate assembly protein